jgi:elongation factor P
MLREHSKYKNRAFAARHRESKEKKMKIDGVSIRPGNILQYKGERLWVVTKIQHTQPGKGGAYMQVEMKDIQDGTKLNERFRSDEKVERVRLDQKDYQYLYSDGALLHFMDQESYEQITLAADILDEMQQSFLQENMIVSVESFEGKPISVSLPETVTLQITEAEPVVKGQTASSSYKPAILENGVRIMVPPHVGSGVRVVVNTSTGEYMERARD